MVGTDIIGVIAITAIMVLTMAMVVMETGLGLRSLERWEV